jgi:GAF domain-containing protein
VKPIAETVEAAEELGRFDPDMDVLAVLQGMADKVQALVPDCMGMSIAWLDQGVAFTLVASDEELAVLDAVQYLAGGPCVEAAEQAQGLEATQEDLLDEDAWRLFSRATAAKGVASTLTIPLTRDGHMVGSANLYAASDHAFEGHLEELARIVRGEVSGVVRNADLTFSTRRAAEETPTRLDADMTLSTAAGIIAETQGITLEAARTRLEDAARRAGIAVERFAWALIKLRD